MKISKKTLIVTCAVILLPILAGIAVWDRLPDPMATHFNMNNEADGFSSKFFAVFGLPLMMLGVHLLCILATVYDPKRQNISQKMFGLILWIAPAISVIAQSMLLMYNLGYKTDSRLYAGLILGMMFMVMGNYLPKARQNYTIGIKIPWTLANEENWNRTHRLAGYLWTAGGAVILLGTLTGILGPKVMLGIAIAVAVIPSAYSFLLHARHGL